MESFSSQRLFQLLIEATSIATMTPINFAFKAEPIPRLTEKVRRQLILSHRHNQTQ